MKTTVKNKKSTSKTNKNKITDKVKKAIDKKKKEVKSKKLKTDIKNKIKKSVKVAKENSNMALDTLARVGITAKEKAIVAGTEISKVSGMAKTNAKKYFEIGKLKSQNLLIQNDINKSFEKIGQIIYKDKILVDNYEIKQLISVIYDLYEELEKLNNTKEGD